MSSGSFITLASYLMKPRDAALFECCTLDPDPKPNPNPDPNPEPAEKAKKPVKCTESKLLMRWREWERALRLNLAKGRAKKLEREEEGIAEPPESPADAAAVAKHALSLESPLEAELFLDKARWSAIENFQNNEIFSSNAMYAYLLKLLLMERRAMFNVDEGFTEYNRLYADILGDTK